MLEAERPTCHPKEPPYYVEQAERRVQPRHSARLVFRLRAAALPCHLETTSLELLRPLPLCKRVPLFDLRHALRFLRDARMLLSLTAVSPWFPPSNSTAWILPGRMPSAATILLTTAHPAASVAAVPSVENKLYPFDGQRLCPDPIDSIAPAL